MAKTLDNEGDDRWRNKGHAHTPKSKEPRVCPVCFGTGLVCKPTADIDMIMEEDCEYCGGTGET